MTKNDNLTKAINSVAEFHTVFRIGNENQPTISESKTYELRHRLMEEENNEYLEACRKGDIVEIADALGDQLYILAGTILKHGLQYKIQEVFDEIHRSNMSKLDANGNPIFREDGKILKSDLYFKPNIKDILLEVTLNEGDVLIAKDKCLMDFENVAALKINKEYVVKKLEGNSIILQSEVSENHYFDLHGDQSWQIFFNKKNVG